MLKKIMMSAGVAVIAATSVVSPAFAAGTGEIVPNPILMPAIDPVWNYTWKDDGLVINYQDMKPSTMLFASICRRPQSDPKFGSYGASCSNLSEILQMPSVVGPTGSGTIKIPAFRGENPDGDATWGCYAAEDVAPEGVEKLTTCYVRLASGSQADTAYAHTIPFTIVDDGNSGGETTTTTTPDGGEPEPVIPEAGTVIALPIVAGGIAALAFGMQRRRRAINA